MASVQYMVLYKYMHPTTTTPITNTTLEKYNSESRFIKGYQGDVDFQELFDEENSKNTKYDMVFMFDGILDISTLPEVGTSVAPNSKIVIERFERCNGEAWFVSSVHTSLQSALDRANPLVKSIGKNNVKVVKNVPIDISVHIE